MIPNATSPTAASRRRHQLHLLDGCLAELEAEHERGITNLSHGLATRLSTAVPDLVVGMPIRDAISVVFKAQESRLDRGYRGDSASQGSSIALVTEAEARALTKQIRACARDTSLLLLQAKELKAWVPLGYQTWQNYVRAEFGMSRSRSYELLDQARVIRAIQEGLGMSGIPDISAYAALQIKPKLDTALEAMRQKLATRPERSVHAVVQEVVKDERELIRFADRGRASAKNVTAARSPADLRFDTRRFCEAIEYLANLPPVEDVVAAIDPNRLPPRSQTATVVTWLSRLVESVVPRSQGGLTDHSVATLELLQVSVSN